MPPARQRRKIPEDEKGRASVNSPAVAETPGGPDVSESTEPQRSEASPQHTPGPWEWKMPPWGGRKWLIPASKDLEALPVDPDYRPILDSDPSGGEYFPAIDPESPDGALIEAAPDLLAALKEAWRFAQRQRAKWPEQFWPEWWRLAQPAIDKAEGRRP